MGFDEILRQGGLTILAFIIGMNIYVLYRVRKSAGIVAHSKIKSFVKMTTAISWLYANQIVLFSMIAVSRYQRLSSDSPVIWIDWASIPVFISYLFFNIYLIKHYILAALDGKLFDKSEIGGISFHNKSGT